MLRKLRAQSVVEYAVLLVIVIGAFIAMQSYMKRGMQGRWKATVDDLGDQYDPSKTNSFMNYVYQINSDTTVRAIPGTDPITGQPGFFTNRVDISNTVETRQMNSVVGGP